MDAEFWRTKPLAEMSEAEWESLCDGCARCCMVKLEHEETNEIAYTAVVCGLLDQDRCRCTRYPERHTLVEDCVVITPKEAGRFRWLPDTCAYRVLAEGRELAWWHPLRSGDPETVHAAGISVRGKVLSESQVHEDDYESMIVSWVET
jgi:uncharacterized cysteine cluster protein YcgN (CxxCxxCC family)